VNQSKSRKQNQSNIQTSPHKHTEPEKISDSIAAVLTPLLAAQVMGWKVFPDRFLNGRRSWLPTWRFQPAKKLEDAFRLMAAANPENYTMGSEAPGSYWIRIQIAGLTGEARSSSQAEAITLAIARAIGLSGEVTR
jgi:hypothetical protein